MLWQPYRICVGQGGCNSSIKENTLNALDSAARKMGSSSFPHSRRSQKILGKSLFTNPLGD